MNENGVHRWPHVRVGDVLTLRNGRAFKSSEWRASGTPIIRIQNLKSPDAPFNYFDGELPDQFAARCGDLLFAWSGTPGTSFGAHVWNGPDAWVNQHIFRVDFPPDMFDRDFLCFALNENVASYIEQAQGGVGLAHITKAKLNRSTLPAPPLAEQRQVAALLRDIVTRRESIAERLAATRATLERLLGVVLAAAFCGRLTTDWRSEHEPIENEVITASARLRDDLGVRRGKPVATADQDALPPLPLGWDIASVDQLSVLVTDGEHLTPPRTESGVPLLSARNVLNGRIVLEPIDFVSEDTYNGLARRFEVTEGDVLLTCSGSVGRSATVGAGQRFALVRSVAVIRPGVMNSEFLSMALRSPMVQRQIAIKKTETAQANLFQGKIRALTVPVPTIGEQQEVVRRVAVAQIAIDSLLSNVERAEAALQVACRRGLERALCGELDP